MFGMGMPEIILILAIALIVIGPRKLPDLGRSLGRALREFRKATSEFKSSLNIDDDDLGAVRRSFSEINSDLKAGLTSVAFGEGKKTGKGPENGSDPSVTPAKDASPPAGPSAEPAASPQNDAGASVAEEHRDAGC